MKRLHTQLLKASLLIVFFLASFLCFQIKTTDATASWYNINWSYRTQITISHTQVASSTGTLLSYFPVLISTTTATLKYSGSGGHVGESNGGDILFTSSDGITKLNHEIETYTSSTGQLVAWVQVPSISTSTDTVLYMYYGNSSAANQQNATSTWNDGGNNYFKAVVHFPSTAGVFTDSTVNANSTNSASGVPTSITGQIGSGAGFNGSVYRSKSSPVGFPTGSSQRTVEAWIKIAPGAAAGEAVALGANSSTGDRFAIYWNNDSKLYLEAQSVSDTIAFTADNAWHQVALVFPPGQTNLNQALMYLDGTSKPVTTQSQTINTSGSDFAIGTIAGAEGAGNFVGSLDEVRVSNVARSADWIATEYNNESSPSTFYSSASEETLTAPNPPTGLTPTSGNTQVSLSWTAPANTGSFPITDYVIDYKLTASSTWSTFADGVSTATTGTVIGLSNGTSYDFRVSAVNAVGQGSPSSVVSATPATLPSAPFIGTVTGGNAQASVPFTLLGFPTISTPWYNNNWVYRKKVVINHTQVSSSTGTTLSYFPVLINQTDANLEYTSYGGHVGKSNGGDILFTASDGVTKLNHEVETYSSSTGQLIAWVQLPTLATSTDTSIYIYYGNSSAADQQNVTSTWNDGGNNYFAGVWHLPNGTTLTANDSTSNGNNGTISSPSPAAVAGQIGGAANFNGDNTDANNEYINIPNTTLLQNIQASGYTLSAWFYPNSTPLGTGSANNGAYGIIEKNGYHEGLNYGALNQFSIDHWTSTNTDVGVSATGTYPIDHWYHVVGVVNRTAGTTQIYVNGVLEGTTSWTPNTVSRSFGTNTWKIGIADIGASTYRWAADGVIDDVQISSTVRSADWVKTSYNNQSSPSTFYSVYGEENYSALTNNGGQSILSYTVTSSPGNFTNTGSTSPIIISGLTDGTSYTFSITATNLVGTGPASSSSNSVIPSTVPNPPTAVTATPGNTQVSLTWSAPAFNGGLAITDYVIEYKLDSDVSWTVFSDGVSSVASTTVTGLTNGSLYDFRVSAVNGTGQGSPSSVVTSTPLTTPNAPTSVTAVRGNTQATVSFTAPVSNGGSTILSYTVTSSPGSQVSTGSTSPITVTGLANGTAYTFTVTATNAAGVGSASSPSNSVTPATTPDAPTSPSATAGNAQASVAFTAPLNNGGSSIISYTVTSSPGSFTNTGSTSPIIVSGLSNGTAYTFSVAATNGVGLGASSVPSNSITPVTVPDAPVVGTTTAGNAQASVSFTVPDTNGGSPITSYIVTSNPGGLTGTGSASPITVSGLTNGTAYTFLVNAINVVGTGASSSPSVSVTPMTVPDAPTALTPTVGNAQVSLSWTVPVNNGGATVSDYVIEYKLTASSTWATFADGVSANTTGTVTGLANGSSYDFRVSAVNLAGQGNPSATATAVPVTVPDAPTSVSATAGNAEATISFTAPDTNGGSPITAYTITSSPGAISTTTNTTAGTITGLSNGTAYTFTVTATNSIGISATSTASNTVTPITTADVPTAVSAVGGNTQATVSFIAPASDGGSSITNYIVTSSPGGFTGIGTSSPIIVNGLTNGTTYSFSVVAVNGAGTSASSSASNSVTLSTPPNAPVNLAATVESSSVGLSWSAPASDGGSPITDYIIEYQLTTGGSWSVFADGTSINTTATVTGLSDNTSYDFRVSAVNSVGQSIPSGTVTAIPGEPAQVLIQSFPDLTTPNIGTAVRITNEGSVAYEYQYTWCITDSVTDLCGGSGNVFASTAAKLVQPGTNFDTTLTSTVPTPGNYWFHIAVTFGSQTSQADQSFTAVATFPDPPTAVSATGGNAQATILFSAPDTDGGSAITGYTVSSAPGGLSATGSTSPIIVSGLTNGTAYTFTVTATNAVGTSLTSTSSNAVTPATLPGAPTGLSASSGDEEVGLSWTSPLSDGGSPITDYVVEYKQSSDPDWLVFSDGVDNATTATVTGLTNDVSYDFRVSAVNALGQGPVNVVSGTSPSSPPTSPPISSGSGGGGYVYNYPPTTEPSSTTTTPSIPVTPPANQNTSPGQTSPANTVSNSGQTANNGSGGSVVSATPTKTSNFIPVPIKNIPQPVEQESNPATSTTKGSTIPWGILTTLAGFVIVGGGVFYIFRRRYKNDEE